MAPDALLLTCEHGGNRVPAALRGCFADAEGRRLLESHRGFDAGALAAARALARALDAPLVAATLSRLVVDLNRSPHNPAVFCSRTRPADRAAREALLERHHAPHWRDVRATLGRLRGRGRPVVHVAVHSFTPVLGRERRDYEIGLLYDPARSGERAFAARWRAALLARDPALRVRRNAPYRGDADGLTTSLRRERGARDYRGIELELNQAWLAATPSRRVHALLAESLSAALA